MIQPERLRRLIETRHRAEDNIVRVVRKQQERETDSRQYAAAQEKTEIHKPIEDTHP